MGGKGSDIIKMCAELCAVFRVEEYIIYIYNFLSENLQSCSIPHWGPRTPTLIMYFGD